MIKIRHLIILVLSVILSHSGESQSTAFECSPLRYNGVAPSPWAIDGEITDWQTLLGQYSNNPFFPFGSQLGPNATYDSYDSNDPDDPNPQSDLRVLSTINDDYNVYFYFRRLHKGNVPNKAFVFLDINLNGKLELGEPVICVNFDGQAINKFSVGQYIPYNPAGDSIAQNCFLIDGYNLPGTVTEEFNSEETALLPNETFNAAVTENGYGVELAVPWRLISWYKLFTYHVALQRGTGLYVPGEPTDNAGGCDGKIDMIGSPEIALVGNNTFVSFLQGIPTYHISLFYHNPTPTEITLSVEDLLIQNIAPLSLPVNVSGFDVKINNTTFPYAHGSFVQQPVVYSTHPVPVKMVIPAGGVSTLTIIFRFPTDNSVRSAFIEITPRINFTYILKCTTGGTTGGGGKPINPVGVPLESGIFEFESDNTKMGENESSNNKENKVLVFPNPSSGSTTVMFGDLYEPVDLVLTDYLGRAIKTWRNVTQNTLKINNLHPGFYLLNIRSRDRKTSITKKILVR